MSAGIDAYEEALDRARVHALEWLKSIPSRPVGPRATADDLAALFAAALQDSPSDPALVIDELAALAESGLMAMPSGRFFGWVIGGTLPAALAADWLVSAWDQNAALRFATPAAAAAEEAAAGWILDLLGLPPEADVGFTTGATMANFVGIAAGLRWALDRAGWDVARDGLFGAPRVRVFVGQERHEVVDLALRYLGLGTPVVVAVDGQGRMRPDALAAAMDGAANAAGAAATEAGTASAAGAAGAESDAGNHVPAIVCLQAGNLHTGAMDPMAEAIAVAHQRDAWVHVDGAFGLWAAASPRHRHLLAGVEAADSWATDAHKTLNVPYDCGVAIVSRPPVVRSVFGAHTDYLMHSDHGPGDPWEKVPELSRRARGVPVWAALRSLGRSGTIAVVDRLVANARMLADGLARIPGVEVVNDVVFTQVCVTFGSDDRTRDVTARLISDGTAWMSGSRWQGRDVLRISVSNWSTDAADVAASLDAVARASTTV